MRAVTVPFFISHQGCTHRCVFCNQRTISGESGILPGRQEIITKIETWRRSAGFRSLEVAFFGGSFTALPDIIQEKLLAPLQPLLSSGEISGIRISTRPDHIHADQVQWLGEHGVRIIELGIQSMDDRVLELSGRGHDAAASEAAIRCIRKHGLQVGAQLMPGLPGDTVALSIQSLEKVLAIGVDFIRLYPVVVLRDTELARRYEAGMYQSLDLQQGIMLCKVLLHMSMKAGVETIRIGLQAAEGLNDDTIMAGCWHPALGQLVKSELYFDLLSQLVPDLQDPVPLTVLCHSSRISDVMGHKRSNLKRLGLADVVKVASDSSLRHEEVAVIYNNNCIKGDIITDINYTNHEV